MSTQGIITGPDISGLSPLSLESPVIGLPEGNKGKPRIDFDGQKFDVQIETKGLRVAWSQAVVCPCTGNNPQTQQPDPNCKSCRGTGFLYVRPEGYAAADDPSVGKLSLPQRRLIDREDSPGVVIRALSIGMEGKETVYDRVGTWGEGSVNITVRQNHKLAHFDRLTYLDSVLAYSQAVIAKSPETEPVKLRFPALSVSFLATTERRFTEGEDFLIDDAGRIAFVDGHAPKGQNVYFSARYLHHPQFLVMSWLNAVRDSLMMRKRAKDSLRSPLGDHQQLPIRVMAQLEFLAGLGAAGSPP